MYRCGWIFLTVVGFVLLAATSAADARLYNPDISVQGTSPNSVVSTEHAVASLLIEDRVLVPGQTTTLALVIKPNPDWHTYWQNPGDSGLPTQIEWQVPAGFAVGAIQWPYPQRISMAPLTNFGYAGEVWLLSDLSVPSSAQPGTEVTMQAKASWLICHDICVPEQAELTVVLPVRERSEGDPDQVDTDAAIKQQFAQARRLLPKPMADWQPTLSLQDGQWNIQLSFVGKVSGQMVPVDFFPLQPAITANDAPILRSTKQGLNIQLAAAPELDSKKPMPTDWSGILVVRDREAKDPEAQEAYEIRFESAHPAAPMKRYWLNSRASWGVMARALLLAFLGGIVLNLMPCVFPVLALKVLGFMRAVHHTSDSARAAAAKKRSKPVQHALWYSAGVVLSMVVLASLLIILQLAGQQLGWGFQLQSPNFVAAMVLLFTVMAFTMLGLVEWGGGLSRLANRWSHHHASGTAFFTGVLATLVATPCTGPFMAIALGLALTMPPWLTLMIFVALGAGLAFPVLLLASWPSLLQRLPRPGAWMEHFKQLLAFPLLASALWLLWVFAKQQGVNGAFQLLVSMLLFAFVLWLWERLPAGRPVGVILRVLLLLGGAGLGLGLVGMLQGQDGSSSHHVGDQSAILPAEPFSPARLQALQDEGRPVLVNFTAAWCLTCKVNEGTTLGRAVVQQELAKRNVAYLVADWTNRDPAIAVELAKYQRNGVPLYLLFWPGQAVKILPQLLTVDGLLAALPPELPPELPKN